MTRLRALVVDFDDTLIPTTSARWPLFIETLQRHDEALTKDDVRRNWGKSFPDLVKSCLPNVDYQAFVEYYADVMRLTPISPLPGAVELLTSMQELGVHVCVFTATSRALAQVDLEHAGLAGHVDILIAAEDLPAPKPHLESVAAVLSKLEALSISSSTVAYVGDSRADAVLAASAGFTFLGVLTGMTTRAELVKAGVPEHDLFEDLHVLRKRLLRDPALP